MKWLLVAAVSAAVTVAALRPAHAADEWVDDSAGRRLRVVFDPGRRIHAGAAHAPSLDPATAEVAAERVSLDAGLTWRHAIDFEEDGVRFKVEHRAFHTSMVVGSESPAEAGELYALRLLRWSQDGSITLPTSPPRRLAFPFGIGFELGVGRTDLRTEQGFCADIGVARGALLLDLMPRRQSDGYLTLGVGPRYDLRVDGTAAPTSFDHLMAPFSQPELAFYRQSDNGHHAVEARARAGYVWSSQHGAGRQAAARVAYEAIVLAINDAPVALTAELRYRYDDPALAGTPAHEIGAAYGLRFGIPLD